MRNNKNRKYDGNLPSTLVKKIYPGKVRVSMRFNKRHIGFFLKGLHGNDTNTATTTSK